MRSVTGGPGCVCECKLWSVTCGSGCACKGGCSLSQVVPVVCASASVVCYRWEVPSIDGGWVVVSHIDANRVGIVCVTPSIRAVSRCSGHPLAWYGVGADSGV